MCEDLTLSPYYGLIFGLSADFLVLKCFKKRLQRELSQGVFSAHGKLLFREAVGSVGGRKWDNFAQLAQSDP